MEYKKFEQHIAKTINDHTEVLDINALIQDIHGKRRKDRKMLWIWMSGLCLLGAVAGYFGFINILSTGSSTSIEKNTINTESKIKSSGLKKVMALKSSDITSENKISFATTSDIVLGKIKKLSGHSPENSKVSNTRHFIENNKTFNDLTTPKELGPMSNPKINLIQESEINQITHLTPLSNKELNFLTSGSILKIKSDKIICPSFSNSKRLSLEIIPEAGIFLPIKKLENGFNEENKVFNLRNNKEVTLEGINAGLYFILRKEKFPLYLKAGFSWSKLTEKMPLEFAFTKKDTTQGIISITYSQTGDTITTIIGDIITERRISGNKTRHHSISLWDIPVSLGVEKRFGRWYAGIEAGAILNLSMRSSGNILASDTSFVNVNTPAEHYKSSLGLSYFGGVQFGRDFFKGGRIYIAARVRYIPGYFNSETNLIRQKYNFGGINLGYVWSF